ncbi:MAG: glycosyltransferase family 2 protein [Acidimicrobiia bacterium]|nr:glycosyltransferase family 2 protein [Acidimicrobiia bacterium]
MTGPVAVSVALVTYHSERFLPDCLGALPAALEGVGSWRLVVADNDSRDGTVELARELAPGATVLPLGRNAGYATGINAVAAAVPSDAVLVLNPDTRLAPGSVRRLLDALAEPGTGIAVPRLREGDGSVARSLRREPTVLRALGEAVLGGERAGRFPALGEVVTHPARYEAPGLADWAVGAVMLVSRRCLDAVGPWDESFFLYSEETDFCLRARAAGFRLRYVPSAEVVHLGGDSGVSPHLWTVLTTNRVRLFAKHHGVARTRGFWAAVVLNEALRAGRRRGTHRAALRALLPGPRRLVASPPATPPAGGSGPAYDTRRSNTST